MRELSEEEIKLVINYYNKKYDLNLKRYSNNDLDVFILNKEIQDLKEESSLSAVASVLSHTFAIHIVKKNNKNILFMDDSYALLNTKDYKISKEGSFETFCHLSRNYLIKFINKIINYIDIIYLNQKRYQFDAGSCDTFGLVNAKNFALQKENFNETEAIENNDNLLRRNIFFCKPTKTHIKYDQTDKVIPEDDILYPELFAIHNKTKELRENSLKYLQVQKAKVFTLIDPDLQNSIINGGLTLIQPPPVVPDSEGLTLIQPPPVAPDSEGLTLIQPPPVVPVQKDDNLEAKKTVSTGEYKLFKCADQTENLISIPPPSPLFRSTSR